MSVVYMENWQRDTARSIRERLQRFWMLQDDLRFYAAFGSRRDKDQAVGRASAPIAPDGSRSSSPSLPLTTEEKK